MKLNLRRVGLATLSAVIAAVMVNPPHAGAAPLGINAACPNDPTIHWTFVNSSLLMGVQYHVVSSTPAFYPSDGRSVENALDSQITATFTATQTATVSVTTSIGSSIKLTEKLQLTVSTTIQRTRSTAIGVSVTVPVPARTRVTGLYGVEGYDVVYDAVRIYRFLSLPFQCSFAGPTRMTTRAPTYIESWRFSQVPI